MVFQKEVVLKYIAHKVAEIVELLEYEEEGNEVKVKFICEDEEVNIVRVKKWKDGQLRILTHGIE